MELNRFIRNVEGDQPGYDLIIDWPKGQAENPTKLIVFLANGIGGMFEAFEYGSLDIISAFLRAIVNRSFGLNAFADVTNVFTWYVDTVNTLDG